MLALHYLLLSTKLWMVLLVLFDLKKPKHLFTVNGLVILILIFIDIWRFRISGFHPMFDFDMIIDITVALGVLFFLTKKIGLLLIATNVLVFNNFIATLFFGFISTLFQIDVNLRSTEISYSLSTSFVVLIIIGILCWLAGKLKIRLELKSMNVKSSILSLIVLYSYGLYVNLFLRFGNELSDEFMGQIINLMGIFAGFVSILIMLGYSIKRSHVVSLEAEKEIAIKLYEMKEKYFEAVELKDKETRDFRHDNKNHYISIKAMAERVGNHEIVSYTDGLIGSLENIDQMPGSLTGSVVVDANLNYMRFRYFHANVELKVDGTLPLDFQMTEQDATTLFSNIFSNAFEAASKVREEKYIKMAVREMDPHLYILVKNNFNGELERQGQDFKTIKIDKNNHGFGIGKIRAIIEKYNGVVTFKASENEFIVEIMLSKVEF